MVLIIALIEIVAIFGITIDKRVFIVKIHFARRF